MTTFQRGYINLFEFFSATEKKVYDFFSVAEKKLPLFLICTINPF